MARDDTRKSGCGGCLVRAGVGCTSALAGGVAVVFALAPTILGDWWREEVEDGFARHHAGRIEVDSVDLAWSRPHVLRRAVLLDPEGEVVGSADLEGPSLLDLLDGWRAESSRPQRWSLERVTGRLVLGADGVSNLERALAPRVSGEGEPSPLRTVASRTLGSIGFGHTPLELECRAVRVELATAERAEASVIEDLVLRADLEPRGPAHVLLTAAIDGGSVRARLDLPGGVADLEAAAFTAAATGEDVPRAALTALFPRTAGWVPSWTGPFRWRLEVEGAGDGPAPARLELESAEGAAWLEGEVRGTAWLDPHRAAGTPGWERLALRGEVRGLPAGTLATHPWVRAARWRTSEALRVEVVQEAGESGGGSVRLTAALPAWELELAGGGLRMPLAGGPASLQVGGPGGPSGSAPAWSLRGDLDAPGGSALGFQLASDAPRRYRLQLQGPGLEVRVSETTWGPEGFHLAGGDGLLTATAGAELGALLAGATPFLAAFETAADAPLRLEPGPLVWGPESPHLLGTLRLHAPGARWSLGAGVAELFVPRGRSGLLGAGPVEVVLGPDEATLGETRVEMDGTAALVSGSWRRDGSRLALDLRVPSGLVDPAASDFVAEYGPLIADDALLPLEVVGDPAAPALEVGAAFRADLLDGIVGSLRDVVDVLGETPGDLAELVEGLLVPPSPPAPAPGAGEPPSAAPPGGDG